MQKVFVSVLVVLVLMASTCLAGFIPPIPPPPSPHFPHPPSVIDPPPPPSI